VVIEKALRPVFLEHVRDPHTFESTAGAELEAALAARLSRGRADWPGVALPGAAYVRFLAERTVGSELPPLDRAADLYIACACTEGVPLAIEEFERVFSPHIAAQFVRSPAFADDVVQVVSERLFVGEAGGHPHIADYGGRGSLRGWLGVIAKRVALNMRKSKADQPHNALSSRTPDALGAAAGPEIALLKAKYKAEFEAAIRASLAALPARDRALLLLHLVDGVTLPQMAAMQNVSRATVARRLASARAALHDGTRAELVGRLRLSPSEYESVAAMVRSQLELSVAGAVRDDDEER
jgi:RNA polymerase sigma-70 factor (ECF subfamily)